MTENAKIKPAVFMDRDGTLIEEVNFLSNIRDLKLFDYTAEAIDLLKKHGYLVIVVTNQSGIGREIYDVTAMQAIHDEIQRQLSDSIDAFYYCPHLPDEGCLCRKPNLGMIEAANADFMLDMNRSWIIGDKKIDVETGFNAGIKTALVKTGYGREHMDELVRQPDIIEENLLDAVNRLLLT